PRRARTARSRRRGTPAGRGAQRRGAPARAHCAARRGLPAIPAHRSAARAVRARTLTGARVPRHALRSRLAPCANDLNSRAPAGVRRGARRAWPGTGSCSVARAMRAPTPVLTRFVSTRPRYVVPQDRSLAWLAAAHTEAETVLCDLDAAGRARFATHIERGL